MTHARTLALTAVLVLALVATGAASASVESTALETTEDVLSDDHYGEENATDEANEETTITVSATGQVEADPDQAVVLLASTAVADDPANATARLAENVSQLREALLAANLTSEQFRTTDFNVFQQQRDERPVDSQRNEAVRYVAQQGFEVTLDDVNRTGEIVDIAVTSGATEVRGVFFTLAEETQRDLREQALAGAMADARGQAEAIAAAENLTVDRVASVSAAERDFVPVQARAFEEAATTADTQIDSGPVTVTAVVQVTYVADGARDSVAPGNGTAENASNWAPSQ